MQLSLFVNTKAVHSTYPNLKGRGAEVKGLAEAMCSAWRDLVPRGGDLDRNVCQGLDSLVRVQTLIGDWKDEWLMPLATAQELRDSTDVFLDSYTWLGLEADGRRLLLFSATPKLHYVWHLAYRARWLSLRRSATWIDEDFVGHMKTLAHRCLTGTQLHHVTRLMMKKYRYGMPID